MHLKLIRKFFPIALFFTVAVFPVYSQVGPAANKGVLPVEVGAGMSDFSLDWGPGNRMEGISAWVDFYPNGLPRFLHGLGVEATGHAIDFGRPAAIPRMRQDSAELGAIYTWNRYRTFRPYAKFLGGIGSIDFPLMGTSYTHDTFTVFSPGGGIEYHAWQNIWIRADYEYQFWHHTFGPHDLNPNGFTIGASYDLRPFRSQ
jgi:opacity protein-like surface antigen